MSSTIEIDSIIIVLVLNVQKVKQMHPMVKILHHSKLRVFQKSLNANLRWASHKKNCCHDQTQAHLKLMPNQQRKSQNKVLVYSKYPNKISPYDTDKNYDRTIWYPYNYIFPAFCINQQYCSFSILGIQIKLVKIMIMIHCLRYYFDIQTIYKCTDVILATLMVDKLTLFSYPSNFIMISLEYTRYPSTKYNRLQCCDWTIDKSLK